MRAIRIIKRAQTKDVTDTAVEKKPVENSTRNLANTVKGWIAETEQRKRSQRHSLAALGLFVLVAFTVGMGQTTQPAERALTPQERAIKITIATTAGFLGQPANRFKVGEQIPVSITMTNTSSDPFNTCISSDIYQDRPRLTRDGKVLPYMNAQSYEAGYAKHNQVCDEENIPEAVRLEPNKPTVADWLVLVGDGISTQADAWYDTLPVGKYELSLQRQLACCNGPMVESNKISFEVVP